MILEESTFAQIVSNRAFWILFVGLGLSTVIFKRRLRELKLLSYAFLIIMAAFLMLMLAELYISPK